MEKGMGEERVEPLALGLLERAAGRVGASVPGGRIDGGDRGMNARGEGRGHGGEAVRSWCDAHRRASRRPARPAARHRATAVQVTGRGTFRTAVQRGPGNSVLKTRTP